MNVLITSASRKVWLVQAFQRALAEGGKGRVVAADCEPASAALFFAQRARLLPRSTSEAFWPALLNLCREEEIRLLVPTRDEELPLFAARRDELAAAGVVVPVAPLSSIRICQDKVAFAQFCFERGFAVARTLAGAELESEAVYPVFARARFGKGSTRAFRVSSRHELKALAEQHGELLVQELVEAPEHSIDVLSDLEGRVLSVVPRLRETVVGGESVVSRTHRDARLLDVGAQLAQALHLRGPAVIQCFVHDEAIKLIEVNPRFGGASALSLAAGMDSPRLLIRMANGEQIPPFLGEFQEGLTMLRYAQDLFVEPARWEALRADLRAVRSR